MTDKIDSPAKSAGDYAFAGFHSLMQMVPLVGGPLSEILKEALVSPYQRRMAEWQNDVNDRLNELAASGGLDITALADNGLFLDVFIKTHRIAMATRQRDKRIAALNALVNVATNHIPDESLVDTFLNWLDELTVHHIQVLGVFADPRGWFAKRGIAPPQFMISSTIEQMLIAAIQDLQGHRDIYDQLVADLRQRGLSNVDSLRVMMSAQGAFQKHSTPLGDRFLTFICQPNA